MEETITQEWFTQWFDSKYYHILYKDRNQGEADMFITNLVKYLNPPAGSFMLDLACGKGRHAISLGKMGYKVTGLDISENNIHIAEKSAGKNLDFYIHDMRRPFMVNYYNYIFNLFTSFGYFDNDRENLAVIANIYNALKPGGTFVLDFANINKCTASLCQYSEQVIDGVKFEVSKKIEANFLIKNIEVTDGAAKHHFTEKIHMFTPADLRAMLENQGLTILHTFGDYNLATFTPESSDRFILIAKKN